MMKNLSWIKGLLFGALVSFMATWIFQLLSQQFAGGITSFLGERWLYLSVIVPCTIIFAVLGGYSHNRMKLTNKKCWLISLICALFVTWYSGTVGAIFGETIVRGNMDTLNIEGTLIWGTIYAFVLLPLTTPFARVVIEIFYKAMLKEEMKSNLLD